MCGMGLGNGHFSVTFLIKVDIFPGLVLSIVKNYLGS